MALEQKQEQQQLLPQRRRQAGKDHRYDARCSCSCRQSLFAFFLLAALCIGVVRALVCLPLMTFVTMRPPETIPKTSTLWQRQAALQDEDVGDEAADDPLVKLMAATSNNSLQDEDGIQGGPYHSRKVFLRDYSDMVNKLKVFVYPCAARDPFRHIFLPTEAEPSGNYASESYFKKALSRSNLVTTDPSQADLFYMPFSISGLRSDPRIGVGGIKRFVRDYTRRISQEWPFWNRTGGSDHFYVVCHSVGKSALDEVPDVRGNVIQVVCSSNYFVQSYIPHKDVPIPQIWPRSGRPSLAGKTKQRTTLAFFAGAANSPVRSSLVRVWGRDPDIKVYPSRIPTSYADALLHSKYCLHVKGFEVNTARIGDAMYYGCVPVVIANHYELAFGNVLDWRSFSVVVTTADIPKLKTILSSISQHEYERMHGLVMDVRHHFQWHAPPLDYDAFYMVMYQLWLRRHVVRPPLS